MLSKSSILGMQTVEHQPSLMMDRTKNVILLSFLSFSPPRFLPFTPHFYNPSPISPSCRHLNCTFHSCPTLWCHNIKGQIGCIFLERSHFQLTCPSILISLLIKSCPIFMNSENIMLNTHASKCLTFSPYRKLKFTQLLQPTQLLCFPEKKT